MTDNEFTCAACGGTFTRVRTDEEAMAEAVANGFDDYTLVVVCEDCYLAVWAVAGISS